MIYPFAKANHFWGVALIYDEGEIVYHKAFGLANADYNIPNKIDTKIGVASLTKNMTQIILIRLIEEGLIGLDDKVSKYLPEFPKGDLITVEMLSRHRSGIPHRVMPAYMETQTYTSQEMVEEISKAELEFEPGTNRLYSSAGYTLLSRVMEIASNLTYNELLEKYVLEPAGMENTVNPSRQDIISNKSNDYFLTPSGVINAELKDYSFLLGAGSVYSTAEDIFKLAKAIVDTTYGDIVHANLVGENGTSGSGRTNGHRAVFKLDKDGEKGYVLLSNISTGAFDQIDFTINKLLNGEPYTIPEVPNPNVIEDVDSSGFDKYFGNYRREGSIGSGFEVFAKNNLLQAGDIVLYPISTKCFFEYRFYGEVCFEEDENGKVKHIIWASPGVSSTWVPY